MIDFPNVLELLSSIRSQKCDDVMDVMLSVFRHELLNPDIARRFHHKKSLLNEKGITKSSETMELDGLFPISSLKAGKSLIGIYGLWWK